MTPIGVQLVPFGALAPYRRSPRFRFFLSGDLGPPSFFHGPIPIRYTGGVFGGEMRLTEKQERLVAQYLRAVGDRLDDMSDDARDLATSQVRIRVMQRLRNTDKSAPDDADIARAIVECGTPDEQAERFLSKRAGRTEDTARPPSTADCRWLGVCATLADLAGLNVTVVRLVTFAAGLVSGPFALIAYLIAYAILRFTVMDAPAPVQKVGLAKSIIGTTALALVFYGCARGMLWLTAYAYGRFTQEALVLGNKWTWYDGKQGSYLFWILMFALPLAALSALPVPKAWSATLKKVAQACMAVYAVILTFAVASVVAGAILYAAQNYGRPIDIQSMVNGL
jgi:phage shock protein PspC (stress-responsive transcriptional regulator)